MEKMAFPLPDEPSIAVMPFENLSGDPAQEYFSDGLTISIITGLYKIPNMFVIHRASSFAYKGKKVKVQQVAEDLGVRYVLEGSVQKAGDRIRLNVQLIDAVKGKHLWAESYDRELKDVFDVQDEITRKVVTEMAVKISWGEQARGWTRMTESHEALDLYYEADKLFMRFEKESNLRARELLTKAIELDPKFARAIAFLGWTHMFDVDYGWAKDAAESFRQAEELANRALAIDDTVYLAHALMSQIYVRKELYEQAIAASERAVEAEPNNATAIEGLALRMIFAGRPEEGLVLIRKAMRLTPHPPLYFLRVSVYANYFTGRYEEAITECEKFLKRQQHGAMARILWQFLITSYMELGREEEARAEAQKLLEQHPDFSVEGYAKAIKRVPFK
ncbi:MAG: adenylate/guanylate cyclase domain-containing protein, partial [Anaerolineales bacterium]|nr:adenylate/guanylate cyclase domain-containing protein [Anaerolineales bacterium]